MRVGWEPRAEIHCGSEAALYWRQYNQATHEKTARRRFLGFKRYPRSQAYAPATEMPLNSPVAIFSFQIAGPVMWALVPPASTATVTGMSTTSNS